MQPEALAVHARVEAHPGDHMLLYQGALREFYRRAFRNCDNSTEETRNRKGKVTHLICCAVTEHGFEWNFVTVAVRQMYTIELVGKK